MPTVKRYGIFILFKGIEVSKVTSEPKFCLILLFLLSRHISRPSNFILFNLQRALLNEENLLRCIYNFNLLRSPGTQFLDTEIRRTGKARDLIFQDCSFNFPDGMSRILKKVI
jgi:hypothetical protein